MRVEWTDRVAFAEVAEVLGVPTDLVMGMHVMAPGRIGVIYTPDGGNLDDVRTAVLGRDADGVLVMVGMPTPVDFDLREAIKRALDDQ